MNSRFHQAWYSPVFSSILDNRTERMVLLGVGGLQVVLHLLGLPGWICPFKSFFGVPCPGCGLTAAVGELLHGRIADALHLHAFAPAFLVVFLVLLISSLLPESYRKKLVVAISLLETQTGITAWVLTGLVLYWSIRLIGFA